MTDIVFCAPDQATLVKAARQVGWLDDAGQIITTAPIASGGSWFYNYVGAVEQSPAVMDDETIVAPAVMAPGLWGRLRVNGDASGLPQIIAACRALGVAIYERGEDGAWIDAPDFVDRVGVIA